MACEQQLNTLALAIQNVNSAMNNLNSAWAVVQSAWNAYIACLNQQPGGGQGMAKIDVKKRPKFPAAKFPRHELAPQTKRRKSAKP